MEQGFSVVLDYNIEFIGDRADNYAIAIGKVPQKRCVKEEVVRVLFHNSINIKISSAGIPTLDIDDRFTIRVARVRSRDA